MISVIICGGRNFIDKETFDRVVNKILGYTSEIEIISGHSKGTDFLAELYAKENDLELKIFPANWDKYGKRAGPIRNSEMLKYLLKKKNKAVIAFWDGKSKGTKNMIDISKKANVHTYIKYI